MRSLASISLLLCLVAVVGCGVSPTAPDGVNTPVLSASTSASSSQVTGLKPRVGFAPPRECAVEAIVLEPVLTMIRPTDRVTRGVEASLKGDASNCEGLVWTTTTQARIVVVDRLSRRVMVYDDPSTKDGLVDVTASLPSMKLEATIHVAFPR